MSDFPDVRRARRNDQERLGALWMQLLEEQAALDARFQVADDALARWNNDFPVWLEDETRRLFAVVRDGVIEGFATAHRWGPPPIYAEASEVYVDELYVVPERRRQGLGTQLVAAVRHWAETLQVDRLRLSLLAANEAGRTFWEQQAARPFFTTLTIELGQEGARDGEPSTRQPFGFW